jgi:uncharacterized protein
MAMTGEVQLSASRDTVCAKLNGAAVVKNCIPGCDLLDKNSDNEFRAVGGLSGFGGRLWVRFQTGRPR